MHRSAGMGHTYATVDAVLRAEHPERQAEPFRVCRACQRELPSVRFEMVAKNRLAVLCNECVSGWGGYRKWLAAHWNAHRTCARCGETKSPAEFYSGRSIRSVCKPCVQANAKADAARRDSARRVTPLFRGCSCCGNTWPASMFYRQPSGKDGLSAMCRRCYSDKARQQHPTWTADEHDNLTCVACKRSLPASMFGFAARNRGGRQTRCIDCGRGYGRAKMRVCYQRNPEVFIARANNRRAKKAAGSGVSAEEWRAILKRYGNRCAYCGQDGQMTMDHVVALARGGEHSPDNVVPACARCNTSKGKKLLSELRPGGRTLIEQRLVG